MRPLHSPHALSMSLPPPLLTSMTLMGTARTARAFALRRSVSTLFPPVAIDRVGTRTHGVSPRGCARAGDECDERAGPRRARGSTRNPRRIAAHPARILATETVVLHSRSARISE